MKLTFKLNGKKTLIDAPGNMRLIDLLRERLELTGTKEGCGKGECGACTVLLDNQAVCSCLVLSAQIDGRSLITIEGAEKMKEAEALRTAFAETGAIQCGFCTPGMILSAAALLRTHRKLSAAQIKRHLAGNLCRCTGYSKIIEAVEAAAIKLKNGKRK